MRNVRRVAAFCVAVVAIIGAAGSVVWFLAHPPAGGGSSPIGLCSLSSPDGFLIRLYLDAHSAELEQSAGSDDSSPVAFVVESGETVAEIAAQLKREGLISNAELFRRYVQYEGLDAGVEAGEFSLRRTMTIPEIAQELQHGRRPEQVLTTQEGLRLEQVAAAVAAQTSIPQDEFLALATTGWRDSVLASSFVADLPPDVTLEGYLFPDTYRLPEDCAGIDLLDRMLETFAARAIPDLRAAASGHGLSVHELVTLASIIEREAVLDEERPVIAGVYHNRLEAGWFLDACPTVQYGLGDSDNWWPALTMQDLELNSPYNTYSNLELPPGPICSPGLASLEAAAYPADTDYYYFLADCTKHDGSHLFAVTEEEHLRNYAMCSGGLP